MMSDFTIGEIQLFSGSFAPDGWQFCQGQTLRISMNTALFCIVGTQYGGNGSDSFQLPNLAPLKESDGNETLIHYIICVSGYFPDRGGMS